MRIPFLLLLLPIEQEQDLMREWLEDPALAGIGPTVPTDSRCSPDVLQKSLTQLGCF